MRSTTPGNVSRRDRVRLIILLLIGLANGLLYVFLIPPWQHYDEPGHFEFAWLIANQDTFPKSGDYDQSMRREMAASMVEHEFFSTVNSQPNLLSIDRPIWIGIPQVNPQALYYWLTALPLRLIRYSDVIFQLYVARLFSLLFYLTTIAVTYGITLELTSEDSPLRWLVPLLVCLLPGLTDIMTAVNDDVGAIAVFTLFLWASVRIIRRGFSFLRLMGLVASAAVCYWTKNTAAIAVLLAPLPILLSLPVKLRRIAWVVSMLVLGVLALRIFAWGDAAGWLRMTEQTISTRSRVLKAPLGAYTLKIVSSPQNSNAQLLQILPEEQIEQIRGKTVAIGAWIWSDHPTEVRTPILSDGGKTIFQNVKVGEMPVFFTTTGIISSEATHVEIRLSPSVDQPNDNLRVFYDGVVLTPGEFSALDAPPTFKNARAESGVWQGVPFKNLIRNGSGESAWPRINPRVEEFIHRYFPGQLSTVLGSLFDLSSSSWYYKTTAVNLFTTFWGKFGWGHVPMLGAPVYPLLALIGLFGILGAVIILWRQRKDLPRRALFFLAVGMLSVWGAAFVRGISSITGTDFIPAARYAYPAIVPTALILIAGWLEISRLVTYQSKGTYKWRNFILVLLLTSLNILAVVSIIRYYSLT